VLCRPLGGMLADRFGPRVVSAASFAGAAALALAVAAKPPVEVPAGIEFVLLAAFLGLGTGGVFAWVALRAPAERVGSVTGIVGAAGGLGGYFPTLVMGATYDAEAHRYTVGLILLCIVAVIAGLYTVFGMRSDRRSDDPAPAAVP